MHVTVHKRISICGSHLTIGNLQFNTSISCAHRYITKLSSNLVFIHDCLNCSRLFTYHRLEKGTYHLSSCSIEILIPNAQLKQAMDILCSVALTEGRSVRIILTKSCMEILSYVRMPQATREAEERGDKVYVPSHNQTQAQALMHNKTISNNLHLLLSGGPHLDQESKASSRKA